MNTTMSFALTTAALLATGAAAQAGVDFFSNDPTGFAAAHAGNLFQGRETFEDNNAIDGTFIGLLRHATCFAWSLDAV